MSIKLLDRERAGLVIIDVQKKLMDVMGRRERVIDNLKKLIHLFRLFNLPVLLTEQYPKMLGPTVPGIKEVLPDINPVKKVEFNCCAVEEFNDRINKTGIRDIVLTGVESHICVFQTCYTLLEKGFNLHVPVDAVDSRTDENLNIGIQLMKDAGAAITSTETIIFQILKKAGTDEFKEMLKLIR